MHVGLREYESVRLSDIGDANVIYMYVTLQPKIYICIFIYM